MGSSSQPSTTTQVTEPPAFIKPYMQYGAQQAKDLYQTGGPQYYPGNTVVPFSSQTEQALGLTEQRALNGSPVVDAAKDYAARTLTGDPTSQFGGASNPWATQANPYSSASNPYADAANPYGSATNPYLDSTFNRAADSVQQRLQSGFAGSGRNIEAARPAAADELNDLATRIYGGAYDSERNRQLQYQQQLTGIGATGYENAQNRGLQYQQQLTGIGAQGYESERDRMASDLEAQRSRQFGVAGLAPGLANQDYVDLQALQGVGGQVEDLTGRLMEDQAARWDYSQNAPQINLDNYIARITGSYPGQSSASTTPTYRNRTAGAVGGAATGAGIAAGLTQAGMMTAGSPWGWALMGAGGLLGAMS